MKRLILALALMLSFTAVSAQNYAVVNSEKIFKSIAAYNEAITQLDNMAEQYQKQVDAKFAAVEKLYNAYMQQRATLNEALQQANEEKILIKKRIELIQPIQKKVFAAIEEYAKAQGFDMIIDCAQNATMLYYSAKADHTEAVISLLKTK